MEAKFTEVSFEVYCTPNEGRQPKYRVFVSGELFAERTWIWEDEVFLEEILPIDAGAGQYVIECMLLDPSEATLKIKNMKVTKGRGKIVKNKVLEVL